MNELNGILQPNNKTPKEPVPASTPSSVENEKGSFNLLKNGGNDLCLLNLKKLWKTLQKKEGLYGSYESRGFYTRTTREFF